ncbi:phage portal protein [Nonomuraea sp. K274]|uniref:Phage portal protein n=1 Tax=Nonomuraea cypriaca TaxID=1187855 RepID=A0A931AF77_9ACTN|nr:phage portal protein [Nonomuraea cypriaca]MBF8189119.1 phage portal protein [Nonomuraea cypriaca]
MLGTTFTRAKNIEITDTISGASELFVIHDHLAPDFATGAFRGGMSLPGAWRAANLIADLIGGIPWHAYRERGGEPVRKLDPTPPLLEQPAPPETRINTFSSWALDLLWNGNAVGLIADRNSDGYPTAVNPVPSDMVQIRRVTEGMDSILPIGEIEYSFGTLKNLGPHDVIHIKGPHAPGELRGMGVLETHLDTLGLGKEQNRQARSLTKHGVPTGLLKSMNPDLTKPEAETLKAGWLASQRDRTVAVLNASTEFVPLSWNPEELQLVEARKFTLHELALIFGIPLSFLGVEQSSRTYTNVEQEAVNILKFSLNGHLVRFEQALSLHFPNGTWVKGNVDGLLRSDSHTRYETHKIGLDAGFLTINEVRELEDLPPIGDANE